MGLRAIVMKTKLKHMLVERIEQLTRLNVSLEQERTKANEKADRYYGWWQEDETKLAELEARIKELEAKLNEWHISANHDLDGPDDVDVERMQSTADHDPEAMPIARMYGKDNHANE